MKLRNLLGVAAGTVGLTAAANRLLTARAGSFEPILDGERGTYRWRGFDVDYVEAGDPDDPDLVLLHEMGTTASNHEFTAVFEDLADSHHVLAPDFPGFGHSDRPPLLYSASLMITFAKDFLDAQASDPTVVASGLSGAYAAQAAETASVSDLVLACPTDATREKRQRWRRTLFRAPLIGEGMFNAAVRMSSIRRIRAGDGFHDPDALDDEILEYEWATSHQAGARYSAASVVSGHLDPEADLGETLAALDVPATLVWGEDANDPSLAEGRTLADAADSRLVVIDQCGQYPHMEQPEAFVDVVRGEYETETV